MTEAQSNTNPVGASRLPALVYSGEIIAERGEMLSLTDMWKAAGSPESKRPAEWLRHDGTVEFVACLSSNLEVGSAHIQTTRGGRGLGGSTFAHWQIGLAYAKYLSPEFHMWCNTVVRERMTEVSPPAPAPQTVDVRVLREARLTFNGLLKICKMAGVTGNHALISANSGTRAVVGVDYLNSLGLPRLIADAESAQITATEVGRPLGLSDRDTNKALTAHAYQTVFRTAKGRLIYEPTEKGLQNGGRMTLTGKRHSDGSPVSQLVWSTATSKALGADLARARSA